MINMLFKYKATSLKCSFKIIIFFNLSWNTVISNHLNSTSWLLCLTWFIFHVAHTTNPCIQGIYSLIGERETYIELDKLLYKKFCDEHFNSSINEEWEHRRWYGDQGKDSCKKFSFVSCSKWKALYVGQ